MSNSPAWDDINPAHHRPSPDRKAMVRDIAARVRAQAEWAVQFAREGQVERAIKYLSDAAKMIEELNQ